jgi:hypothetical protein
MPLVEGHLRGIKRVRPKKVYTFSEARQRFAEILNTAREEEVVIKRRGG